MSTVTPPRCRGTDGLLLPLDPGAELAVAAVAGDHWVQPGEMGWPLVRTPGMDRDSLASPRQPWVSEPVAETLLTGAMWSLKGVSSRDFTCPYPSMENWARDSEKPGRPLGAPTQQRGPLGQSGRSDLRRAP